MATNYITIKGVIENGELKVELPDNVVDGEVEVTIPISDEDELPWEERAWTEAELTDMLNFEGKSLGDIETGGWENLGITDSLEFVEDVRRKEEERHSKWTLS